MQRIKPIVFRTINSVLIFISFLMVVSCNRDNSDSVVGNPELDLQSKGIELEAIPYSDIELPEITIDGKSIDGEYYPSGKLIDEKYRGKYDPRAQLIDEKYYPIGKLIDFGKYKLSSGKYKMRVSGAFICHAGGKYIYFDGRIRADEWRNEFWIVDENACRTNEKGEEVCWIDEEDRWINEEAFKGKSYYEDPFKVRIYLDPPIDSSVVKYTTFGTLLTEYNFEVIIEIIGEGELDNSCMTIDNPNTDRSDTIAGLW